MSNNGSNCIKLCNQDECTGCGACKASCPMNAISVSHGVKWCKAEIDDNRCIKCGKCLKVCPQINPLELSQPVGYVQGWASNENERLSSSSGGFCSSIAKAFIRNGGIVFSCEFNEGRFCFSLFDTEEDINRIKGSKYVKSDASDVYGKIQQLIRRGSKVLFIGLPCQVAAVKKICELPSYSTKLFTIDLICHGTPAECVLERYLKDKQIDLSKLSTLSFRNKGSFQINGDKINFAVPRVVDSYSIAFLNSLTYTDSCYRCRYASLKRCSDLTVGDSWGTLISDELKNGISLALWQTEKGKSLLDQANLTLNPVDIQISIANNAQLDHPSIKPSVRKSFLKRYDNGMAFDKNIFLCFPLQCLKQFMKKLLIKQGIL